MLRTVLLVDDDVGCLDFYATSLSAHGFRVHTAPTGQRALRVASCEEIQLLVVDWRLPDMLGGALVSRIRSQGARMPFVAISGFLTTRITVDLMRLGAFDVLEKPLAPDGLIDVVQSALYVGHHLETPPADLFSISQVAFDLRRARIRSSADRWAVLVLSACRSESDLRTLGDWAKVVALSYTSLRELCRVAGVIPHEARDFMRVLRAILWSRGEVARVPAFLHVSDERTLKELIKRAGLRSGETISVGDFLDRQHFVDPTADGFMALSEMYEAVLSG